MNSYKTLQESLIKDFKGKDFVNIKKMIKNQKVYKVCTSISFVVLGISVIPSFNEFKFPLAIIGVTGILLFENKNRNTKECLKESYSSIEDIFKKYLNTEELQEYRENRLKELEEKTISKRYYLTLNKEEIQLILNLIKNECSSESNIDVIAYKNDVNYIFENLNKCKNLGVLTKDDVRHLEKKWQSDLQVLRNQYIKTELEIDLNYLQGIINKKEV